MFVHVLHYQKIGEGEKQPFHFTFFTALKSKKLSQKIAVIFNIFVM